MAHSRKNTIIEEKHEEGSDLLSNLSNGLSSCSLFRSLPSSSARVRPGENTHRCADLPERGEIKRVMEQLLAFAAHGEKDQAEAFISQYPALLLLEGEALDYSGRKLRGTALEMALGAEDVNLYANNGTLLGEGMVEMLMRHFRKLPDSEDEITRQILKQFPEGWEEEEEKRHEEDLKALTKVSDVIKASSSDEACEEAILEFKKHLLSQEVITTGKHWNVKLLQAAFELGHKEYYYNGRKDNLFFNKVIGSIQACAPANVAMAQTQGLYYLLRRREQFKRDLKYRYGGDSYYSRALGGDLWFDSYNGAVWRFANWSELLTWRDLLQNYIQSKTTALQEFMPQPDNHDAGAQSRCIVM